MQSKEEIHLNFYFYNVQEKTTFEPRITTTCEKLFILYAGLISGLNEALSSYRRIQIFLFHNTIPLPVFGSVK